MKFTKKLIALFCAFCMVAAIAPIFPAAGAVATGQYIDLLAGGGGVRKPINGGQLGG